MAGTFRTDSTFLIKGHGLFVRGTMASGTAQTGGSVTIPAGGGAARTERITRIELGQAPDAGGDIQRTMALQLGSLAPADVARVRRMLVPGLVLDIADPGPA